MRESQSVRHMGTRFFWGCFMSAQNPIVLIPARMASMRLPNKPLAMIDGVPMIVRVWQCAVAADCGRVVVAAGDASIAEAIGAAGGEAVLTDPDLPSGSDPATLELMGRHQSIDTLAENADTIGYEILTSLGPRYSRRYIGG